MIRIAWNRGKKLSETHRQNLKKARKNFFVKGGMVWNKGKKGSQVAWNKGLSGYKVKPCSEERKIKIGLANSKWPHPKGEKHYHWKGGNKKCIDCGQPVKNRSKITKRCIICSRKFMVGRNAANWRNGASFGKYGIEFNEALREQVRFRDKYKCQHCGCPQIENGRQLDVHHINYNKRNNTLNNLISLCQNCHRKTFGNRKYWKDYFQKIMEVQIGI